MLRFTLMLCLMCLATDIDAKPKKAVKEVSKDPVVTSHCEFLTIPIADRFYVALRDIPLKDSPDDSAETIVMIKRGNVLMAKLDEYSDDLNPSYSNGYIQLDNVGAAKIDGWASAKYIFSVLLLAPLEIIESGVFECLENTRRLYAQAYGGTFTSHGFIPRSDIRTSEMLRHAMNREKRYMYQMLRVVAKRFGREAHLGIIRLLERKYPPREGSSGFTIENLCPYQLEDSQLKKPTSDSE